MKKVVMFAAIVAFTFGSYRAGAQVPVATPVVVPTLVLATHPDPKGKVPVINGVPGAGVANLDLGFPTSLLVHGGFYVYIVGFSDTTFTGTCAVSYKLTQIQAGKTVTLDTASRNVATTPGDWAWAFVGKTIPSSPGLATLTGTTKCGTATGSTHIAVYLQ